tara:strand:- start:590 stop:811 length:222 start_codon:yes stop_codon:yes gene_type:complete
MESIEDAFRQEALKREIEKCTDIKELQLITIEALTLLRNQRILFLDIMNEHMAETVIKSTLEAIKREEQEQSN